MVTEMAFEEEHSTKPIILIIALVAIACLIVFAFASSLFPAFTFLNTGNITAVDISVYSDSAMLIHASTIDWGNLNPGDVANQTVYVRNEGNVDVSLNMTVSAWNPSSASDYMNLSWDQEGCLLSPTGFVEAILTLNVSSSIMGIDAFSFNITIIGIQ
jgi:hypothetical protein